MTRDKYDKDKEETMKDRPDASNEQPDIVEQVAEAQTEEQEMQLEAFEQEEKRTQTISPARMVTKRFLRSRLSIIGLIMIIFVFAFSFLGPIIVDATWGYGEVQNFRIPRQEEMVTLANYTAADGRTYDFYDKSISEVIFSAPLSAEHWLGTDTSGFDILTRLMYGGRISLSISFIVIILQTLLGVILGGVAGFFGGWVDQIIMRIVDVFACLPGLPMLFVLSAAISSMDRIPAEHRIYYLMAFLAIIGWTGSARLIRGQILMLREQEFMLAAETTGVRTSRKIFKHLVPNALPQLIVSATLGLGGIILYESTLSYFGLGVPFPRAAWGSMIALADPSSGQQILANYPNMWIPPGILIVVTVLGFSFIGDGLRDAFDPRMSR